MKVADIFNCQALEEAIESQLSVAYLLPSCAALGHETCLANLEFEQNY